MKSQCSIFCICMCGGGMWKKLYSVYLLPSKPKNHKAFTEVGFHSNNNYSDGFLNHEHPEGLVLGYLKLIN